LFAGGVITSLEFNFSCGLKVSGAIKILKIRVSYQRVMSSLAFLAYIFGKTRE
jgi:hypothetical protein